MDTGMFQEKQSPERIANAIYQVQRMGYEFHIVSSQIQRAATGDWQLTIEIRNTGIAPFYHDWKVELGLLNEGVIQEQIPVSWTVKGLLPGDPPRQWKFKIPASKVKGDSPRFALRIANPMPNGLPLRFANDYDTNLPNGWWTVGVR
jgi:hypothetical protein